MNSEFFRIDSFNELQNNVLTNIDSTKTILHAPTGSGKTIAFLISAMNWIKRFNKEVLIITPSRELALQIHEVVQSSAFDLGSTTLIGGRKVKDEKNQLDRNPKIIIGTPGRILDHYDKGHLDNYNFSGWILDEFDKILEFGFQNELSQIHAILQPHNEVLVSATKIESFPEFIETESFVTLEQKSEFTDKVSLYKVPFLSDEKIDTLFELMHVTEGKTMIFCNHRERVDNVFEFLNENKLPCELYHGGLTQNEREKAILKLTHGSVDLLVCTDVGARGLDIDDIQNVIHYQLPDTKQTLTHRNGRTGRQGKAGNVFVLDEIGKTLPETFEDAVYKEFVPENKQAKRTKPQFDTLYINVGKKDKLRKMDFAGAFMGLDFVEKDDVGKIEVFREFSYVSVKKAKSQRIKDALDNQKIKKRKVRVSWCK